MTRSLMIATAKAEIGTREGRSNNTKYADEVPGLEWADYQPWCATFVSWCALKSGVADLYPRSASCDAGGAWFKKLGRWSEYPAVGAQVFYGTPRDLNHTGIVVAYDLDTITTVEGNTNADGGREGHSVLLKNRLRRGKNVIGYGYPKFPAGIESADPAWSTGDYVRPGATLPPAQPPAGKPGYLRVDGADISHHQTGVTLEKLLQFKHAGGRFLYHKASQGEGFVDKQYPARRRLARAAGIPFGAYHYANPDVRGSDGTVEAKFFLSVAKPLPGDLLPVLDLEENEGCTRAELTRFVRDFAAEVKRQVGAKPVVYTQYDLDDSYGCPLWVARYSNVNAAPKVPAPWKGYSIRQFSNGVYGRPNSIAGLGHVDLNTLTTAPGKSLGAAYRIPARATGTPPPAVKPHPQPAPPPPGVTRLKIVTFNVQRDRPPAKLYSELWTLTQHTRADVLMLQETHGYLPLLTTFPGYQAVTSTDIVEQSESMILVKSSLKVTGKRAVQVTFDPDGKGPGIAGWWTSTRGARGPKTPAKHVMVCTVAGVTFVSGHPAPSVQNPLQRLLYPLKWRSYREWSRNVEALLRTLGTRVVIGADWNVDARTDSGRTRVFPRAMLAAAGMRRCFPAKGTHGNRAIDGFGSKGVQLHDPVVLDLGSASDHRPVVATLDY